MKWGRKSKLLYLLPVGILIFLYTYSSFFGRGQLDRFTSQMEDIMKWYNYTDDNLNGQGVAMDDQRLVTKLRNNFLIPPPELSSNHKYRLKEPQLLDASMGQGKQIRNVLGEKKNGFFIECGALDGETRSNTLYFERFLNWTGLLIEADPLNFAQMTEKNRRAWLSPTCLSVKPYPEIVSFEQNNNMGKISEKDTSLKIPGHINVQCFPIFTYFLALNITHVDYFSLDVEGAELDVLQTIPFDKVDIQTMSVEFIHVSKGQDMLKNFMESKGYKVHSKVTHPNWLANDFIFVKV